MKSHVLNAILAVAFMFAATNVDAYECKTSDSEEYLKVMAEFLYWKPCVDDLDYAAVRTSTNPNTYTFHAIDPEWEPGFRVTLSNEGINYDGGFSASYTYIKSKDTSHVGTFDSDVVVNSILHPALSTSGHNDYGVGLWDTEYQEFELLMSKDCCKDANYAFTPFIGVAAINVDQIFTSHITDVSSSNTSGVDWNSDFWGVGLRAGSKYVHHFENNLSFHTRVDLSILAGSADTTAKHDDNDDDLTYDLIFNDDDPCQLVPGYHIAAALTYDFDTDKVNMGIKLGYEFMQWFNLPNHRNFSGSSSSGSDVAVSASSNTRTLGFHGVSLGLYATF